MIPQFSKRHLAALLVAACLCVLVTPGMALAEDGQAATSACGQKGLFNLIYGETLCKGQWAFSLYYNKWDRRVQADPVTNAYDPLWTDWDMDVERLSLAVGYGITDKIEFSIMLPYWQYDGEESNDGLLGAAILNGQLFRGVIDQSGIGDVRFGAKFQIARTDTYATAIHAYVDAPTGDDDEAVATGEVGLGLDFVYNNQAGWVFNLGYFAPGDPDVPSTSSPGQDGSLVPNPALGKVSDQVNVGIGYEKQINEKFDWITELSGILYTDSNGEHDAADIASGGRFHFNNPDWAFNAALRVDLSDTNFDYTPIGGLLGISYAPKNRYELAVTKEGSGTGTVKGSEGQLDCGATCTGSYYCGGTITLTATPDPGSRFDKWGGDCAGMDGTTTITLDDDKACSATFIKIYDLTVEVVGKTHPDGDEKGKGAVNFDGKTCDGKCTETYDVGTKIDLAAKTGENSTFGGWSIDCSGGDPSTSVTLDSDKTCVATFIGPPRPCIDKPVPGEYAKCGRYSNKTEWSCDSATWTQLVDGYAKDQVDIPVIQLPTDENEKKTPLCDLVNFMRMCPEFTACIAGRETADEKHCTAEERAARIAGFLQAQAAYPFFKDITPNRYELAPACKAEDGKGRSVEIFLEK